MDKKTSTQISEGLAEPLADIVTVFVSTVNVLRKQPGFDNIVFEATIKEVASRPRVTEFQRALFHAVLGEDISGQLGHKNSESER